MFRGKNEMCEEASFYSAWLKNVIYVTEFYVTEFCFMFLIYQALTLIDWGEYRV